MARYNDTQLLAQFEHDSVTNSLQEPDSIAFPPNSGTGYPITSVAAYFGPTTVFITDVMVAFGDIAVTDPSNDLYLGWSIQSATDFGASPTYAELVGYTADGDLPLIHDNSASSTAIQAVVNAPVNLFNYIGATRASPDVLYATIALQPSGRRQSPVRVPSGSLVQVRVGTYLAGSLSAVTGLDNVTIFVYGYRVGPAL